MTLDEAIKRYTDNAEYEHTHGNLQGCLDFGQLAEWLKELKQLKEQMSNSEKPNKWIPVSKRLPEELEPVNITWVNHNPESYYADIKDKPFTATGYYCKGKWYWFSSTCEDYLREYGRCDVDEIDADVEVTAWMPLPTSYKAESEEV